MERVKEAKSVFVYVSKCCNAQATKEPCVKVKDSKVPMSLGSWHCSTCGKSCSVNRSKNVQ
jgi:hypothetical protein